MCTNNELNIVLQKLYEIYQNIYAEKLIKVILYGSYARGDYDNESDIDVAAIVEGKREILQKQLRQVWDASSELELEYGTIISPTVIPLEDYEKYQDDLPYYRNIKQEGVEVSA